MAGRDGSTGRESKDPSLSLTGRAGSTNSGSNSELGPLQALSLSAHGRDGRALGGNPKKNSANFRSARPNLRQNKAIWPPKEFDFGIVISVIELRTTFVITEVTRGVPRCDGIHHRRAALVSERTTKTGANMRAAKPNLRQNKAFLPPKEFDFGIVVFVQAARPPVCASAVVDAAGAGGGGGSVCAGAL